MGNFTRSLFAQLLIFAILVSFSVAAKCPSRTTLDKAISATEQIDSMVETAITAANFAVNDQLITPEQKSALDPKLSVLQKGVRAFRTAAVAFKQNFNGDDPPDALESLKLAFDEKVYVPFLEVLRDLKLVKNATKIVSAIGIIRLAVINIAQALNKSGQVAEIERESREVGLMPPLSADS